MPLTEFTAYERHAGLCFHMTGVNSRSAAVRATGPVAHAEDDVNNQ
jgi:hypothetical protein